MKKFLGHESPEYEFFCMQVDSYEAKQRDEEYSFGFNISTKILELFSLHQQGCKSELADRLSVYWEGDKTQIGFSWDLDEYSLCEAFAVLLRSGLSKDVKYYVIQSFLTAIQDEKLVMNYGDFLDIVNFTYWLEENTLPTMLDGKWMREDDLHKARLELYYNQLKLKPSLEQDNFDLGAVLRYGKIAFHFTETIKPNDILKKYKENYIRLGGLFSEIRQEVTQNLTSEARLEEGYKKHIRSFMYLIAPMIVWEKVFLDNGAVLAELKEEFEQYLENDENDENDDFEIFDVILKIVDGLHFQDFAGWLEKNGEEMPSGDLFEVGIEKLQINISHSIECSCYILIAFTKRISQEFVKYLKELVSQPSVLKHKSAETKVLQFERKRKKFTGDVLSTYQNFSDVACA